jgi:hypothetical protein
MQISCNVNHIGVEIPLQKAPCQTGQFGHHAGWIILFGVVEATGHWGIGTACPMILRWDGEQSPMEYKTQIEPMLDKTGGPATFVPLCKSIISARAASATVFGSLCANPGCEMLLDLYWRDSQGLKTSLTSFWLASKASEMTGRRCLAAMEEQGIVERFPDPFDKRRTYVRLTAIGREKMDSCFRILLAGYAQTSRDCANNYRDAPDGLGMKFRSLSR